KKLLISGLATCSLAVVGVLLFQQMPIHTSATFDETLVQMPVTPEPELATAAAPEYSRREAEAPVRLARQIATQREAREKVLTAMPARPQAAIAAARDTLMLPPPAESRARFAEFQENTVKAVSEVSVAAFAIDVDTASYSLVRRRLDNRRLPPKDAGRSHGPLTYFDCQYRPR